MPGTVHLLAGAAIGILIQSPTTMFVVAFFSHYLLDLTPHIDPDTFAAHNKPYTWTQFISLIVDIIVAISFLIALILLWERNIYILVSAIAAQIPDILQPLEQYTLFNPIRRIHRMFHWDIHRARRWDWYVVGLVSPMVISAACLLIIWRF